LTVSQLNLLIETIGIRGKKDAMNQAIFMRLAISASLTKEGADLFHQLVDEVFTDRQIIRVTTENLSKFKIGVK